MAVAPGAGWRGLALFWTAILVLGAGGAGTLQWMGPIEHQPRPVADAHSTADAGHVTSTPSAGSPQADVADGHARLARVAAPDPALLETSKLFGPAQLPRVAADGRRARVVYAAPSPAGAPAGPRVALLLVGFGLSDRDSRSALEQLPGPVSFGVSAYAVPTAGLLDGAREAGHELLASVPMEPQGYPLNDEGTRSLRTGLPPEDNRQNLDWALSRTPGAVGATGASDGMRGERFSDVSAAFEPVLDEIGRRGLLYVDPRPGRAVERPGLPVRAVDVVLDDSPARADIEAKLRDLERVAREHGSALGLAGQPRPVTVERMAAWTKTLQARGIVLVPVSALIGEARP